MALLQIQEPGQALENQEASEIIIGIDLGTTNSLVAIIEDEKVRILKDEFGEDIQPSIVEYDETENVIGVGKQILKRVQDDDVASSSSNFPHRHPELVSGSKIVSSIKRLMGKSSDSKIKPEQVSAEILKHLKNIAEKNLKTEIKKAVITVPAYFDEAAKNATKLAAKLANLEVVRLVNEPTAAALAYGLDNSVEGVYCVYDLGGGTFDVSILKMQKGVFKVLGVAGDNHLGGDDFDELLAQKGFKNPRKIKEELSSQDFSEGLSRAEFENLISEKIQKTITLTKNLLDDLELEAAEIKGVILVGGSTRIPLVRKKLSEIFGEEKILTNLDPDRVVAIGAAWQAYNLAGHGKNLLLDVTALSLGIEMMGGIVDKIIHRNSTIPISKAKEFTTYADNQSAMKLHIVQGERELASDCRSLANFEIKNIPLMKAGMARILVTFKVDADGLLTVSAEEKITGTKQEIEVRPSYSLDENEIKKMLFDSLKNSQVDMENRLLIETLNEANRDIAIIKKDLSELAENERKNVEEKLKTLEKLIEEKRSRDAIILAQQELTKSAENLILRKVNAVLNQKIAGKKVDEV